MSCRFGADIGGTFTDIVLVREDGATLEFGKVLTTPAQPDDAVIEGVETVRAAAGVDPGDVAHVVHGTTLFTNALIERKGAKTALITTKGFRDAIEIGREHRYDMYDLYMRRPEPLAPRHLRFEVEERVLVDGSIRTPLQDDEVRAIAERLRQEGTEAVAISLMHAYANDVHERRIEAILKAELPTLLLTLSSDLVPEIGEYVRTSTALANVYVKAIAERYLGRLRDRLRGELNLDSGLFIMQSNGGVCEIETAKRYPIRLVESGPAAGALAAAHYGALLGHDDLLSFDMGGTTAKACVISGGKPLITNEFEVDRQYQFKKQSGLPIKIPAIEMIEIGTGGGSIARIDALRRLQVGPDSAGADPGPASYALGGQEPTVTDADLVLGYLDPSFFLGGKMSLDVEAAKTAILTKVAKPLDLSLTEAAWGIHQLANENMASAARIHTIERGKDATKFPIFAFGGAGPVHAFGVARILRSPRVIYPLGAGVMSSIGFLTAPLTLDFARSYPGTLEGLDWQAVAQILRAAEEQGREILGQTIADSEIRYEHFADMRYHKQGHEVRVPVPPGNFDAAHREQIRQNFEETYSAIYGHTMQGVEIEVVSWRVLAHGPKPTLTLPQANAQEPADRDGALKGRRAIFLPDEKTMAEVPVYSRYDLPSGATFEGPAVIEERESTVVVNGRAAIHVDQHANLVIDLAKAD